MALALSAEPLCLAHVASPARWWVLLVVTLMNILQSLLWNVFSPISETVKLTYGWADSDFVWAVNAANVSFMLALVPINKLYDLYGARQTMLLSTASLAFCGLVRCLPLRGQGFMVLVQLSMLANGITAAWANIAGPLISDLWFPARERTLATAIAVTGPPIGQALGFILGPSLVGHPATASSGLPAVQRLLWFEASFSLAVFLAAAIYFPAKPLVPPSESAAIKRHGDAGGYERLLPRSAQACRFWLLNLCFSLPIGCYQSWGSVLNLNLAGVQMSPKAVSLLGCWMTLSGAAGSIAVGLMTKRLLGALKSIILLCAGVSFAGFLFFAALLTADVPSSFGTLALGSSGILGGFGINCMLPLFFELILETVYGFVRDDVAATTTMLTMSSIQILVLLVPVKIAGSSLWMNWLMVTSVFLCFFGVSLLRARYSRLAADVGHDIASRCDQSGCF